jgi:hypothetical protein
MWAGGVAGAAWAGTWAAPTLVIPVVGEITERSAILLGGIVGGIYFDWLSRNGGKAVAGELWQSASAQWQMANAHRSHQRLVDQSPPLPPGEAHHRCH